MKIFLTLFLGLPAAFAEGPPVQILIAPRYQTTSTADLRATLERLATFRSPGQYEFAEIDSGRPLLGGEDSVLGEVRKRVSATPTDRKLNLHLVIKSHGSEDAIHSDTGDQTSYAEFAEAWRTLMADFVARGYRPENLSFDLFLHFCFSGMLRELIGPALPFDTLVISSAARDNTGHALVLRDLFERALPALRTARAFDSDLHEICGAQELLFLLLTQIYLLDLNAGWDDDGVKLPAPEVAWWPASARNDRQTLTDLAHRLFELYARALHDATTHRPFINTFRFTMNEYYGEPLSVALRTRAAELSPVDRLIYDHLFFHTHFDNGMAASEVTAHFDAMRTYPGPALWDAATHDLLMLSGMIADEAELLVKFTELELRRDPPDAARLERHLEYLQGYDNPLAVAACQRLLTALGR